MNNSAKKIVFFDIDATVWDWDRVIPESCKKAIWQLRENGHLAFICSGRARGNLRAKSLEELDFDGVVAACGTYIEIGNKVIFNRKIAPEIVKLTVETVLKCNLPVVLEGDTKHWISEKGFEGDDFVIHMREEMGENAVLFNKYTEDMIINKFSGDQLRMSDYETLKKTLSPYYDFIEHGLTADFKGIPGLEPEAVIAVVEAVPCGFSKATGIRRTCEHLGIDMKNTYAIGDSVNDLEMLECVEHSICMGNGSDPVKAVSEYVTTDIHDDGVYNALKHYGLI